MPASKENPNGVIFARSPAYKNISTAGDLSGVRLFRLAGEGRTLCSNSIKKLTST